MDSRENFPLLVMSFQKLVNNLRNQFPSFVVEYEIQRSTSKIQETILLSNSFVVMNRTIISQMHNLEFYRVYWNHCKICRIPQSSVEPEEDLPNCA